MKSIKGIDNMKTDDPSISTIRGMSINRSDEWENAANSMYVNLGCDSNVIDSSFLQ
jgi:hypothetical protein